MAPVETIESLQQLSRGEATCFEVIYLPRKLLGRQSLVRVITGVSLQDHWFTHRMLQSCECHAGFPSSRAQGDVAYLLFSRVTKYVVKATAVCH